MRSGLRCGSNVGTQLRARRAKAARDALRDAAAELPPAPAAPPMQLALPSAEGWFAARGQTPFAFQREVWAHISAGRSGLLHATTGSGKTYAVYFGLLDEALHAEKTKEESGAEAGIRAAQLHAAVGESGDSASNASRSGKSGSGTDFAGSDSVATLRLLWITPMRALAADTARALAAPLAELDLKWRVGVRTGDTDSAERTRQSKQLPEVLVTTPESLTLMFTRADAPQLFARLSMVVVDEWHELIGSKRGVQVQLALARLRRFARQRAAALGAEDDRGGFDVRSSPDPQAQPAVWGLSATLGNLEEAKRTLLHPHDGVLVQGRIDKAIQVDTLIPENMHANAGRFPWGGHLGIRMVEPVAQEIDRSGTTLIFTNTRSQAELWYQALLEARPKWAGTIALHHGSLDREVREWVERGLKAGSLRAVVATSSLDPVLTPSSTRQ